MPSRMPRLGATADAAERGAAAGLVDGACRYRSPRDAWGCVGGGGHCRGGGWRLPPLRQCSAADALSRLGTERAFIREHNPARQAHPICRGNADGNSFAHLQQSHNTNLQKILFGLFRQVLSTRSAVRSASAISSLTSGSALSSSNSPPLNQSTCSNPTSSTRFHRSKKIAGQRLEFVRPLPRMLEHPLEHFVGKQVDIFREHAEDQPINEMRDNIAPVITVTQSLGQI